MHRLDQLSILNNDCLFMTSKMSTKAQASGSKKQKAGDGIQDIRIIIDSNIVTDLFGSCLLANLSSAGVSCELNHTTKNIIKWQRKNQQIFVENQYIVELSAKYTDENFILKIFSANELNQEIEQKTLQNTMRQIQNIYHLKRITLLVCGMKEFCRKCKNVGRLAIETNLTELQVLLNINHRLIETSADLGITVVQFSKSIGDIPFKKQQAALLKDQHFYVTNDNKDCVPVKGTTGLSSLWQHHLIKLPLVALETAEAIIGEYPMPRVLFQAYENNPNGPELLANVPVRRAGGPLTTVRKIGPELSKKLHSLYTKTDPNYFL